MIKNAMYCEVCGDEVEHIYVNGRWVCKKFYEENKEGIHKTMELMEIGHA